MKEVLKKVLQFVVDVLLTKVCQSCGSCQKA